MPTLYYDRTKIKITYGSKFMAAAANTSGVRGRGLGVGCMQGGSRVGHRAEAGCRAGDRVQKTRFKTRCDLKPFFNLL